VFFPNPAHNGLELRNTIPDGFASNDYVFGKFAQVQQKSQQQSFQLGQVEHE